VDGLEGCGNQVGLGNVHFADLAALVSSRRIEITEAHKSQTIGQLAASIVGIQLRKTRSLGSSAETWRATFRRVGTSQQRLAPKLRFLHSPG
jgi:hypothetical protein